MTSLYLAHCNALDRYLDVSDRWTVETGTGTGTGDDDPVALPPLRRGEPVYDTGLALVEARWGSESGMPSEGKPAWQWLLRASRVRSPRVAEALMQWVVWLRQWWEGEPDCPEPARNLVEDGQTDEAGRDQLRRVCEEAAWQREDANRRWQAWKSEERRYLERMEERLVALANATRRMEDDCRTLGPTAFDANRHAASVAECLESIGKEGQGQRLLNAWRSVDRERSLTRSLSNLVPGETVVEVEAKFKLAWWLVDECLQGRKIDPNELAKHLRAGVLVDAPRWALAMLGSLTGTYQRPDWLVPRQAEINEVSERDQPILTAEGHVAPRVGKVEQEKEHAPVCPQAGGAAVEVANLKDRERDLLEAYLHLDAISQRRAVSLKAAAQKADPGGSVESFKRANARLVNLGLLTKLPPDQAKKMYLSTEGKRLAETSKEARKQSGQKQ